jgi:SAM-dependent methyltransferase
VLDPGLTRFVKRALPPPPARVLEVGAGDGELAAELASAGYDVVAIDPASTVDAVKPIALHELDGEPGSFDASVAVLSMHHVEPLPESCRRLAELVRGGGSLVLDELDVDRFDERAGRWWLEHRQDGEDRFATPDELLEFLRHHCHPLSVVLGALGDWFELAPPARGAYLYRWQLPIALRASEEQLIAGDRLPATGARIVGVRR